MSNWIVGTHALHGNPYGGRTLGGAIARVERLTAHAPQDVTVDQGYRGHGYAARQSYARCGRFLSEQRDPCVACLSAGRPSNPRSVTSKVATAWAAIISSAEKATKSAL